MARSCKMLFTCYKFEIDWTEVYSENSDEIRYIIVNPEQCPTTKRRHWQGYIQFYKSCRYAKFQKMIGDKCYMEIAKGSAEANQIYCSKLKSSIGDHKEFGSPTSQGKRNDLIQIKNMIDNGKNLFDVANEYFGDYVRYFKGFERYKNMIDLNECIKRRLVEVTLLTGPTGCGKTKYVLDLHGDDNVYIVEFDNSSCVWWDGYRGENIILLDDYDNNFRLNRLLRILDSYKLRLPIKGNHTWAKWHKIYITTNLKEHEIHLNAKDEHRNALFRRINEIKSYWGESGTKCIGNINYTQTAQTDKKNELDI